MIDVYHEWHKQLKAENEDFYLKIWLYEPDFIRSQIVAAYKEAIHFYSGSFDKQEEKEAFSLKIYEPLEHELNAFEWEPHIHTVYYRLSDLEEDLELGLRSSGDVLRIKEMSYSKDNDGKDEWYKVDAGTVWVGSLKEGRRNKASCIDAGLSLIKTEAVHQLKECSNVMFGRLSLQFKVLRFFHVQLHEGKT